MTTETKLTCVKPYTYLVKDKSAVENRAIAQGVLKELLATEIPSLHGPLHKIQEVR